MSNDQGKTLPARWAKPPMRNKPVWVVVMDECGCVVAANNDPLVTQRIVSLFPGSTARPAVGREATRDRLPCSCYGRQAELIGACRTACDERDARLRVEADA